MQIFISGTNTNIGKTIVCSWLCLHTGYGYFKPIQTGSKESIDSLKVSELANCQIYKEAYSYKEALSPHLAASIENSEIEMEKIKLPKAENLIVEGAGGLLVPINKQYLIIDLIKYLSIPLILVADTNLGTINHSLLSIEAVKNRGIKLLGVIMNGKYNLENNQAIEFYGNTKILANIDFIQSISRDSLSKIPLTNQLKQLL